MKNMSPLRYLRYPALAACALMALQSSRAATTLLSDTFADADRTNQSLSGSAAWFLTMDNSNVNLSGGGFQIKPASGAWNVVTTAYFTNSGAYSLAIGETISLSFEASFAAVTGGTGASGLNNFRFGLYNSNGSRQTGDITSNASSVFNGYTGYSVFGGSGGFNTGETVGFYERTASAGPTSLPVTGANNSPISTTPYIGNTIGASTVYNFTLTLERTASGLDYTVDYAGITLSGSDNSPVTTSFDSISFFWSTSAGTVGTSNLTLDNINVSVVPEPSALGLMVGGLAIGLTAWRGRRSARI